MYIGFHQEKDTRDIGLKRASWAPWKAGPVGKGGKGDLFIKSAVKNLAAASNVQQVNKNTISSSERKARRSRRQSREPGMRSWRN